jgi:hypothetical protein
MGAFLSGYSTGLTVISKPWERPTLAEILKAAREKFPVCARMPDDQLLEHLTIDACKLDGDHRTEVRVVYDSNLTLRAKEGARCRGEIPD